MARSIQSPGVEIIEKDLSLSPILPAGTNIFMTGFAAKGPTDDILQITSVQELEQVYGTPTNSAERYFYYGARQILNSSNGNLYVSRMPYGQGNGDGYGSSYGALVYPVVVVKESGGVAYHRNTTGIDPKYFQDISIRDSLSASGVFHPLTGTEQPDGKQYTIAGLSADGIDVYGKFSFSFWTALQTAWLGYQSLTQSNPTLSAFGVETANQLDYFVQRSNTVVTNDLNSWETEDYSFTYLIGAPKFFDLSVNEYKNIVDKTAFTETNSDWTDLAGKVTDFTSPGTFGKAGLIVVNKIQSTINNKWEGQYVGIEDNTNLQPNTNHNTILNIYTNGQSSGVNGLAKSNLIEIPNTKLSFVLSASNDTGINRIGGSLSETFEKAAFAFSDITTPKFSDTISVGVFKLRTSPYNPDAVTLDFALDGISIGSLDYYRQINNVNGGIAKSFYIETVAQNSSNINILVNSFINEKDNTSWLKADGTPKKKVRVFSQQLVQSLKDNYEGNFSNVGFHLNDLDDILMHIDYADGLYPVGCYSGFTTQSKDLGNLPLKLDRTLRKIENDEIFDLDIVLENGLGTVYASVCANETSHYDDIAVSEGLSEGLASITENEAGNPSQDNWNVKETYSTIFQLFDNFVSKIRKDCVFIADPLRHIFISGANNLTLSDPEKAFSKYIFNPLKHLYSTANSSYSITYGNWVKVNDIYSGMNIWVPFSPFAAADIANVDQNFEPWYAPAGFTRGRVTNALALAIAPKQKERDMLYKININPVAFFPNDGFNIFGQKTLLRQPSAFDRINVRRLFLYLEKATKKTVKYFVFEPNTLFTRSRVKSVLTPIFDRARNTQGLYDYQIVCDARNNPPAVIDQNEMVIDIYLKPVRTAEFILVNFYATSTSTNFNEIIGA